MPLICNPYNSIQSFLINLTLHVVILFTILGFLFMFYISKVARASILGEINSLMKSSFNDFITYLNNNPPIKKEFDLYVQNLDVDQLQNYYAGQSEATVVNNNWVMRSIITTIIILVLTILLIVIILKFHCGFQIYLTRIVIINMIIFIFVGVIELLFFVNIISKYIPVKPSFVITTLLNEIKKNV